MYNQYVREGHNTLSDDLARLPKPGIVALGALLIALLAAIDYATGYEVSFSIFYLIPAFLVTWYAGLRWGTAVAVVAVATWGAVDVASGAHYSAGWIPLWNSAVRFGFFLITCNLLEVMRRAQHRLGELADTDSLTGAPNARSFYSTLEREIRRQQRYGSPFALAYIDLDHFKKVNDKHGHAAGDELLRAVATEVQKTLRNTDIVARLGGDEFAVLLPETAQDSASQTLSRLHTVVMRLIASTAGDVPGTGATIGAVVFENAPPSADAAIGTADALMYDGKRLSRGAMQLAVWTGEGLAEHPLSVGHSLRSCR